MSNLTTTNVPAHIAERIAARKTGEKKPDLLSAVLSGDSFPYPRISIRAGRYRLIEEGVETVVGTDMDVIIVGVNPHVSKVLYTKPYDPEATDIRPDCFSNDGIRPDESVVAPPSPNCATCPNNVLGSKITPSGAKSKMCADQRHLAVVPAADPTKVYALTISVSAMKGLRTYFKHLQNYGIAPNEVITRLSFDDQASFPRVTFAQNGFVSPTALPKIDAIVADGVVKEIVRAVPLGTYNRELKALPQSKAELLAQPVAQPAAQPAAQPVVQEGEVEAIDNDLEAALASIFQ